MDPGFLYEHYSKMFLGISGLQEEKGVYENDKTDMRSSKLDMFLDWKTQEKNKNVNIPVDINMSTIRQEISNFRIIKLRVFVFGKSYSVFKFIIQENVESERLCSHCGIINTKRRKRVSTNLFIILYFEVYLQKNQIL